MSIAAIVIAGTLAYSNSLSAPLVFDDAATIAHNASIRDPTDLQALLSPPEGFPVWGRPLVNLTFALNYAAAGTDPLTYHVVNLAVHLLCGLALFGLMRRTLDLIRIPEPVRRRSAGTALIIALVWTVHPLNSEVVNTLSSRTESMMALCYLLAMYCSLRAVESDHRRRWLLASVVACAAGMTCKESMVTAPVIMVLYDSVFLFEFVHDAVARRWRFYGSLAVTWIPLGTLIHFYPRRWSSGYDTALTSPWTYLMNQAVVVTHYLREAIWPDSLVLLYGWVRPLGFADVWPYVVFLGLLLLVTLAMVVRRPMIGFAGLFVFVTLSPASSIVPLVMEVGAERRMYLPLAGLTALVVIGAVRLWVRATRAVIRTPSGAMPVIGAVAVALACGALTACTRARNREYASALTLARTSVERWPSPGGHYILGVELSTAGQYDEALQQFQAAVPGPPPARYGLAVELFRAGRMDEAIAQLQAFIAAEPRLANNEWTPARMLLARAFARTDRWPEAIDQSERILSANPNDADAHDLLAAAFIRQQNFDAAIPHYRTLLAARPTDAGNWANLGIALVATRQFAEAVTAFRRAVEIQPREGSFRVNLVRSLLAHGGIEAAAREAQAAIDLTPDSAPAHEVLGLVEVAEGHLDQGRREFERSLQIDPHYVPALEALRQLSGRGGR